MLTPRLQKIKTNLQGKYLKSFDETQLLTILDRMDKLEILIASSENATLNESQQIFEMIIRPLGNECNICGRTL